MRTSFLSYRADGEAALALLPSFLLHLVTAFTDSYFLDLALDLLEFQRREIGDELKACVAQARGGEDRSTYLRLG